MRVCGLFRRPKIAHGIAKDPAKIDEVIFTKEKQAKKVLKSKEKAKNPVDSGQKSGAAGQIRTADLILTNYNGACYSLCYLAIVFW